MKAMKVLQKILFTIVVVIGLTLAVSAQDKKPPPKPTPPVVTPAPTKPPPDSNKPKKPGGEAWIIWKNEMGDTA